MYITCLDLEGVLVPEIWIAFAEASGIPELKRTTRDEPDYNKLMNWRLGILKEHGLGLKEIQETIRAAELYSGHYHQRHLYPVRNASHGEAGLADDFLQLSGGGGQRRDHRL